jgi:hypothetical protein
MAKTALVGPDINLGSEVLRLLDAASFPLTVALWIFKDETGEWEFTIGSPLYDKAGGIQSYRRLLAALAPLDPNVLHDLPIRILSLKNPLIRGLRRALGKTAPGDGIRIGGHAVGGIWVDDGYVYRIR